MMPIASLSDALPFSSPDPQMVNLNATNISVPVAFVGTRSMTNPGAPITAAEWIYIGANMGADQRYKSARRSLRLLGRG